jgi:phosphoserine aminotransferase
MNTVWNFSAGPAMLPKEVLEQAQAELLDWCGLGVSVMEISHRSPEFEMLTHEAMSDLRTLLALPEDFEIIFTTGGAQAQFALVPLNLLVENEVADYLVTGWWSQLAMREAARFAKINVVADDTFSDFVKIPDRCTWRLNPQARYFHYVSNETVHGVQFKTIPDVNKPLIADMSSDILSKPLNFERFGLIYAGAQKNIGPAGLTLVIIRRDYLSHLTGKAPKVFDYTALSQALSSPNTPPTFVWYLAGLVFKWLLKQGGLSAIEKLNEEKASLLYQAIDQSRLYYCPVDPACRSTMNVVFDLKDSNLLPSFLAKARECGLMGLKGHKVRGGVRASIYNAMPLAGVEALVKFMKEFEDNT